MNTRRDPEGQEIGFLQEFVDFSEAHVLEVGCGDGYLTWQYAPSARRVVGIDMDVEALREGLKLKPDNVPTFTGFVAGTAGQLPFPDACFDVVLFSSSL